jgi:hypothetical protein
MRLKGPALKDGPDIRGYKLHELRCAEPLIKPLIKFPEKPLIRPPAELMIKLPAKPPQRLFLDKAAVF